MSIAPMRTPLKKTDLMKRKKFKKYAIKKRSSGLIGGTKLGSTLPKPAQNTSGTSSVYNPYTRKLQTLPSNYRT